MAKDNKGLFILIAVGVVAYLVFSGGLGGTAPPANNGGTGGTDTTCTYQPTATYSVKDTWANTAVSGTAYYKQDGVAVTTTAITNLNKDETYEYWVDNNTYYVAPAKIASAGCGNNPVTAFAFQNGTPSFTGYDLVNRQSVSDSAYNTSMGANDRASIEFTYQGQSKRSLIPFGGVFVIEYNSTISTVDCTGNDITEANDFHVTYTPTYTTHTYKVYKVLPSLDDGTGKVRTIDCQFQNGATAAGDGPYITKVIPADYYVTNDGNIALDVEEYLNQATTKTAFGSNTATYYWKA